MDFPTATCATPLPAPAGDAGAAPDWVMLMPAGTVATRPHDGRPAWRLADPAAVVAATRALGGDLVIDYEHQTDRAAANGQKAPAAGWIKDVEARADGLWARVEWTPVAAAHLAAREYRYLSPTFQFDQARNVKRVLRAALTNDPALTMGAIASATGDHMDELLKQLRAALGLADTADQTAIVTGVATAVAAAKAAAAQLVATAKALGLAEDATPDEIATAAAKKSADPDPAKFVPVADFTKIATDFATLQGERAAEKATAAVDAAVAAGKLAPAQRDWALGLAKSDPKAFEAFVAAAPVIVAPGAAAGAKLPSQAGAELTGDELAMAKAQGITPDEFKKSRDALAARAAGAN